MSDPQPASPPSEAAPPAPASPVAPPLASQRELGFDLARSFAIVMMVLVNFQLMLAERPASGDDAASRAFRWLMHVPSGRSSSLFVVLAGVGISLLTASARRARGPDAWWERFAAVRTLLLRSGFLLVSGLLLWHVWWIDILHFYACYLLIAAVALWWLPDLALLVAYVAVIGGGAAVALLWPELPSGTLLSPVGFLLDVLVEGVHPVLPWLAFVIYGIFLGRRDLSDRGMRWRAALMAGAVLLACELGSLAITVLVLVVPALSPLAPHLDLFATGWTPDPLYVISACSSATLLIVLAHELMSRPRIATSPVTRAMIATGQLALTIYVTHAVIGVVIPRALFGWRESLPVTVVAAYWLGFCAVVIVAAAIWRRFLPRGPLEWVMRALTSWRLPRERRLEVVPRPHQEGTPPPRHARPLAAVLLGLGALLVVARIVGVPLGVLSPPAAADGTRLELGQLSLFEQRQTHPLTVAVPTMVVLETRSGLDLYLELDQLDETGAAYRITEDDDGGDGTEARIAWRLEPGSYRVTVRPYGATTGPYALSIATSE